MTIVPLLPHIDYHFGVTYRNSKDLNAADRKFLDFMQDFTRGREKDGS